MEDIILYKKQTHTINLNNSGTMNQQNLDFAKRTMLFDVIREHTDLVKTKQGYPNNDISDVEMELDIVIIPTKVYTKILKLVEGIKEERQTVDEYLKFPKLKP